MNFGSICRVWHNPGFIMNSKTKSSGPGPYMGSNIFSAFNVSSNFEKKIIESTNTFLAIKISTDTFNGQILEIGLYLVRHMSY